MDRLVVHFKLTINDKIYFLGYENVTMGQTADATPTDAVVAVLDRMKHKSDRERMAKGAGERDDMKVFEDHALIQGLSRTCNIELIEVQGHCDYLVSGDVTSNRPKAFMKYPEERRTHKITLVFRGGFCCFL